MVWSREISVRPKEGEIVVIKEDIHDQIVRQDLISKYNISKHYVKTAPKSFSYPYLDLDLKNYRHNQNKIKAK